MSDFKDAFEEGKNTKSQVIGTAEGASFLVYPKTCEALALPRTSPARITEMVNAGDIGSFVAYFEKYARADSIVKVSSTNSDSMFRFDGIIDYHAPSGDPGWCDHIVSYAPKIAAQWGRWLASDKKAMSQDDFAEFVEAMAGDFVEPDSATMLEIAATLEVASGVNFRRGVRLHDGRVQLQYVQQIEGRAGEEGRLEIPRTFKIGARVFFGREAYEIEARLKYRLREGAIKIWYEMIRAEDAMLAAFETIEAELLERLAGRWLVVANKR